MIEESFRDWLKRRGLKESTAGSRISNLRRVEEAFGDLDKILTLDGRDALHSKFTYSMDDERNQRPNPTPISIEGNLRTGLASLSQAIGLYAEFLKDPYSMTDKPIHQDWLNKITGVEILAVMDDCDREGIDTFLQRVGFSKPQQWTVRPADGQLVPQGGGTKYPCKATVAAAIAKLPHGPELNARAYFNGFGEAQSRKRLQDLGFEIIDNVTNRTMKPAVTRDQIEEAMQAYDAYQQTGAHADRFANAPEPKSYWVRSTRRDATNVYPTKPIVRYILQPSSLNGGWSSRQAAAAVLHNAGYVIVDADDQPVEPPEASHLKGADRIRVYAYNYFIAPARDAGDRTVEIKAKDIAKSLLMLRDFPNICQSLGGKIFRDMIGAIDVQHTDPNPSSTTVFTYHLGDHPTPHNFAESTHEMESHPDTTSAGQQPTNLILYGPPGTGKTFATAAEAIRLCGEIVPDNRTDVMETYHRLCGEKRIEFVTFHQSSSYEDFIEGRQPMTDGGDEGGTGFRLETVKGVFRRISERAEQGKTIATGEGASALGNRQVFKMSIGRAGDAIDDQIFEVAVDEGCTLIGWEDMDFSDPHFADIHEIHKQCRDHGIREGEATLQSGQVSQMHMFRNQVKVGDILVVSKGNSTFRAIGEVTGEYSYEPTPGVRYSHRRAVRWIWVDRAGVPVSEIYGGQFTQRSIYRLSNDKLNAAAVERFLNVSVSSVDTTSQQFVLIIDEINRANISKVFGELITLIEADKRLRQPNALKVRLPYSGAEFGVPDNLHIIGTMNTADRSIALLDTALRRRFDFREMPPEPDTLKDAGQRCGLDLVALLTELNERIEYLYDRDHLIGHAYFINCQSRQHVDAVMRDKIIPLLAEYFFEDWSKIAAVLGDAAKDDGAFDGGFLRRRALKVPPGMEDSGDWMPRFRWSVKSGPFSYEGIVGQ